MRLVATEYISLDGVFEEPGRWSSPFFDDQAAQFKFEELNATDAQLLGRKTYEGFAKAWPTMEGTGDFGVKMNTMPKHVASRTLREAEWNATILEGELGPAVTALKEGDGADLLIYGSGEVVDQLTGAGLIDEYRLMVHPVLVGTGKKLFEHAGETSLRLADTVTTETGVAVLTYRRSA